MTKIIKNKRIVRDEYDGHVIRCDWCNCPFSVDEWYDRHECDPDKVYHADCCPVCNQDDTPDCHSDADGGL